jgi:hypothetical protein
MNTLHDAFERQAGNAGVPDLDIDELVGLGERRLRRRRLAAVAGAGAAVAVAIALAVGGTALNRSADQNPGPIDHPPTNHHRKQATTPTPTRPIVYSDVSVEGGHPDSLLGDPIHVGDRVVETGSGWVHMDVTDHGVVYTTGGYTDDGRVWFTDGGTPEQIGSHACVDAHGWPGTVVTGNAGSLAAWFDCTAEHHAELVVYDTGSGREVVRREVPGCSNGCLPGAIVGDRVYISRRGFLVSPDGEPAAPAFAQDIRDNPRGLVVGDTWETGTPTLSGHFTSVGTRLVPNGDGGLTSAFDTATRRPVELHLPAGYAPDPDEPGDLDFGLFEWLDDDTVALENVSTGRHDQDILTCGLSTGRCELAIPGLGRAGYYRVVQIENLGNVEFCLPPCVP